MILRSAARPKRIRTVTETTLTASSAASALYSCQTLHLKKATRHLIKLAKMKTVLARVQKSRKGSESVTIPLPDRSLRGKRLPGKSDRSLLLKTKPSSARSAARKKKNGGKSDAKNESNGKNLKDCDK